MCGILGTNFLSENFNQALDLLESRGPDFSKITQYEKKLFGHTRLAILDLDKTANQPMEYDNFILVFNGEIYNYLELQKEHNLTCKTKSDSEVLLRLYQKYGKDCLELLNGMFSFCIYNKQTKEYFCARDRYGKKPFFYYYSKTYKKFIFASSIKSILKILNKKPEINKFALGEYFSYFCSQNDNTFYQGIKKLEPSSYLYFKDDELIYKKYYKIKTKKTIFDETEALAQIKEKLINSIKLRLRSDADIGILLSGGLDSSLLCSLQKKYFQNELPLYSLGFETHNKYDETSYASIVANHLKAKHKIIKMNKNNFIDTFSSTLDAFEEPHCDSAGLGLNFLMKHVKQDKIKVLLSGEGSDELFFGYDNYAKFYSYYLFAQSLDNKQKDFLKGFSQALQNNTKESEYLRRIANKEKLYHTFGEIYNYKQKRRLFLNVPKLQELKEKKDFLDTMSYFDIQLWLNSLLTKVDRMSMANSIEVRCPYLDFNLVDLSFKIDSKLKMGDTNKYLIKKLSQSYLPQSIITRQKKGFNMPFNEWLFEEYSSEILDLILRVNKICGYFNEEYIRFIYSQAQNNKFKQHLYSLYVFARWFEEFYL